MILLDNKNIKITRFNKLINYKNLGLYKIIKVFNNFTYKLDLFNSINNIYLVFYL